MTLSGVLKDDVALLQASLGTDLTLRVRYIAADGIDRFCLLFYDGMVSGDLIDEHVIRPLSTRGKDARTLSDVSKHIVTVEQANPEPRVAKAIVSLVQGDAILLMDGETSVLTLSAKGYKTRGISEPDGEKLVRGPREGFTESLMTNTSLIRRKLPTPDLQFEGMELSSRTGARISLCYLASNVDKAVLMTLKERIKRASLDAPLDSNFLTEAIRDGRYSPFKTVGSTEKPDIAAAKIMEGKIVILVDGSPVALTVPFLFLEYFQTGDDYYINFVYGSVSRLLRIVGFFLTVSVPAVYLAVVTYHYEIIPTKLLLSISAARQGVPFPTFLEMLLLLLAFELLREAGAMMPDSVGQALSTVGAIVVGQAAVDARIVSAPMVIVLALTGLTAMMSPKLQSPVLVLRLVFLTLAAAFGLYGYLFGVCVLVFMLMGKESFGVPYMAHLTFDSLRSLRDTLIRAPGNVPKTDRTPSGWGNEEDEK